MKRYAPLKPFTQPKKQRRDLLAYQESADKVIKVSKYDRETGITSSYDMQLGILKPTKSYMPEREDILIISRKSDIQHYLSKLSGIVSLDIETNGVQAADPNIIIVGLGLADANNIMYIDYQSVGAAGVALVKEWLLTYKGGFIGHNIMFDGTFLERDCGEWINWVGCTYGMYKQLATEGHPGQTWGLKDAQLQLLGYDSKGDVELDEWLCANGHYTSSSKIYRPGYVEVDTPKGIRFLKPSKGDMFRAPKEILGMYCGIDAASTWQLWHECFIPSIKDHIWYDNFMEYHRIFVVNTRMLAEQQLGGITIDKEALLAYHENLLREIKAGEIRFRAHPKVAEFGSLRNSEEIEKILLTEPTRFKKAPLLKPAPEEFKKNGEVSKNYLKWKERKEAIQHLIDNPVESINYGKWKVRVEIAKQENHFNLNSGPQLQRFFYEFLDFPIKVLTKSEAGSTGAKALPGFGEVGTLLKNFKDNTKEESYVSKCKDRLQLHEDGTYRIHPQFRSPGTLTGRLAGSGGLNLQQLPKSIGYLECWKPMNEDMTWVDLDVCSLEQVVLAELSRDPTLLKLYDPAQAREGQDVYLFNGSELPIIGPKIKAAGYIADEVTPEMIAKVKKECKKERGIAKVLTLSAGYGAGATKIHETLNLQGVDISLNECYDIHKGYWSLYGGIKRFQKELEKEYRDNNGYILNGIGRPLGIAENSLKDIVNRTGQSTGHDCLMILINHLYELRKESGIWFRPIIMDFHDESLVECRKSDVAAVIDLFTEAYDRMNNQIKGLIPLREDGGEIGSLAEAKCEALEIEEYREQILEGKYE